MEFFTLVSGARGWESQPPRSRARLAFFAGLPKKREQKQLSITWLLLAGGTLSITSSLSRTPEIFPGTALHSSAEFGLPNALHDVPASGQQKGTSTAAAQCSPGISFSEMPGAAELYYSQSAPSLSAYPHPHRAVPLPEMSAAESPTIRWLRQNVGSYPNKDRIFLDAEAALARFATLRPKSDVYTYDDGRTQLLLCLHGLLPIHFRGAIYNIPIAVWITRDYPRLPPIPYVVPTHDMLVRPTAFVDVSGRCNIEYIQVWQRKSEGCNLAALLGAMQEHFSHVPPLYAKPAPLPAPQPVPSSSSPRPSRPPLLHPPASQPSSPRPHDADRPPLPPKPVLSPSPPDVGLTTPGASSRADSHDAPRPPVPPPPPRADTRPPQYQQSPIHLSSGANLHHGNASPASSGNYRGSPESPPLPISADVATLSTHVRPPIAQHTPPLPPQSWRPPALAPIVRTPPPNLLDTDLVDSTGPQHSLASAPPRPPNPELLHLHVQIHDKIRSELASLSQGLHMDAERLRTQQADLLAGEFAIRDEMARLEAVRDVCRNVSSRLRSTVVQGERNLTELRRKGDPEVDELVCSTSIVHNQLINLVAEDNAIEDTIYHLHRALNAGRIDLERFLRTTRVLAEEQFMKRALIEKIQEGVPIEPTLSYK